MFVLFFFALSLTSRMLLFDEGIGTQWQWLIWVHLTESRSVLWVAGINFHKSVGFIKPPDDFVVSVLILI
jgi:hypothetical protein